MKILLAMGLTAFALLGCKGIKTEGNLPIPGEGIGGLQVPSARDYTDAEVVIGRRICNALKYKREKMQNLPNLQEKFLLKGETRDCASTAPNIGNFSVAISNSAATALEYEATSTRAIYFKDVVTDDSGAMDVMCDNLWNSNVVANRFLSGSSYINMNILIRDGYDTFEVFKQTKDSSGNYPLVSTESISVITQRSQAEEKFFGIEKERVRNLRCSKTLNSFSYTKQSWLQALTAYGETGRP